MNYKILLTTAFLYLVWPASGQSVDWLMRPGEYSDVSYLGQGLFKVRNSSDRYGIVSADGKIPVTVKYDSITPFVENKALLMDRKTNRLWGIINAKGEIVKDFSEEEYYVTRYPGFKEGRLSFKDNTGLCGYMNEKGEIAITPHLYFAAPFQDGIAAVQYTGGDYGLINKGGKSAIVSNAKYAFVSSPVDGKVIVISGSRKGADALRLCKIDGVNLKTEKTLEDGMNIWLSDDFSTIECQKGGRYYIDSQWRVYGSNTNNAIPEVKDSIGSFYVETSKVLGVSNVEGGLRITYLGNPIVNNVFPDVSIYDDYAIVHSREGKVGVLKLNKSAAIDIQAPENPVVFYHNNPVEVLLDVDLKSVNPDKLHWYRNDTGYLTHSSLECHDGKYQLRIPYFKPNSVAGAPVRENVDIAFTYDGLDWMHHTLPLQSTHSDSDRFEVTVSGPGKVDASGKCSLNIIVNSLNGPANGKVTVSGSNMNTLEIDGESLRIPITVSVPDNTSKKFSYTITIEEEGCPDFSIVIDKTIQGRTVRQNNDENTDTKKNIQLI